MLLCLDVGNTHIFAGVFSDNQIILKFRYPSTQLITSDLFGIFLKNVLRENNIDPNDIKAICLSSVVPSLDYSINAACMKYFAITPLELKPGIKTGLKLDIKNPLELGSDRIATAVAAIHKYPDKNIIVVDFGTATTVSAISKNKSYLGGAILPGFKISMEALCHNTEKLSPVEMIKPNQVLGKTTESNIQSGLYYGQLGAVREIITRFKETIFYQEEVIIIATGGFSLLLEDEKLFSIIIQDLILQGLHIIWQKNSH